MTMEDKPTAPPDNPTNTTSEQGCQTADEAVRSMLDRIVRVASDDADQVGQFLAQRREHFQAIGVAEGEIPDYQACERNILIQLYDVAANPHPSPAQLMRLALQFALDARRPIEGNVGRFELRPIDQGYHIIEYPSFAQRGLGIPIPGYIVCNPFAVQLLDFLQSESPPIYQLMAFLERQLDEDVESRATEVQAPMILLINPVDGTVQLREITYAVDPVQAHFLLALQESCFDWQPTQQLHSRPELAGVRFDRLCKKLPAPLRELVESQGGKGYRLRRDLLA